MKNRVLYFPYIRVPDSPWLTQMLLYWDQVSSIVPYEYLDRPEELGETMRSLVEEGLVWQVIPGEFIDRIPQFAEAFEEYLDGLGPEETESRRARLRRDASAHIHIEKLGPIGDDLCALGLAVKGRYPWFDVERDTADEFMSYLATGLGKLEEVDSTPVTDQPGQLDRLVRAGVGPDAVDRQLEAFRLEILDQILPIPSHEVSAEEIRFFKEQHGDALSEFRRRVEREIITLADIADDALRERRKRLFLDEAAESMREIESWMEGAKWRRARAFLQALVEFVPGASKALGLLRAVGEARGPLPDAAPSRDFAYAAYARAQLA